MKRITAFLLFFVLIFSLFACSGKGPAGATGPSAPSASESDAPSTETGTEASPSTEPSAETDHFIFTRENFPRMDGSTSTIPLGQAVACVLLGEQRNDVADLALFNKTTQSFRNLMNGECDILIVAEPNADVYEELTQAGFEYEKTPIATDALVFIVNATNPVSNLTTAQVQNIYAGGITNWSKVGGDDVEIRAFQRNADAGSQALMEKLVMKGLEMMTPPEGYTVGEMEGLISAVKSFDGSAQAIGYTVYYYAEDMKMAEGLKILSIDGVEPNDETIASGAYPFLNPYYAVIAADEPEDSPARILYNWLLSPEGQNLIKTEGYVPAAG
jgi:phosphate transport system substrate-binding protein